MSICTDAPHEPGATCGGMAGRPPDGVSSSLLSSWCFGWAALPGQHWPEASLLLPQALPHCWQLLTTLTLTLTPAAQGAVQAALTCPPRLQCQRKAGRCGVAERQPLRRTPPLMPHLLRSLLWTTAHLMLAGALQAVALLRNPAHCCCPQRCHCRPPLGMWA